MGGSLQLLGLLALAFLASAGVGTRGRSFNLAGLLVLVGMLLGPVGLSLLDEDTRALWHPLVSLSTCWLGLLYGVRLRAGAVARAGAGGAAAGLLGAIGAFGVVAGGLYLLGPRLGLEVPATIAVGVGIVSAPSGRAAIRFARQRLGASGPLGKLLDGMTAVDDLVPVAAVLLLAVLRPSPHLYPGFAQLPGLVAASAVGLGLLLTATLALSAGRDLTIDRTWIVLIGSVLLATGAAERIGVPEIAVGLTAGVALPMVVPARLLAKVVSLTERPATMLLLVLIGAQLVPNGAALALALVALLLRVAGKLATGALLPGAGSDGLGIGLGLLGHDGLALAVAAQLELLYGGHLGEVVLVAVAVQAVAGDLLAPLGALAAVKRHDGPAVAHG